MIRSKKESQGSLENMHVKSEGRIRGNENWNVRCICSSIRHAVLKRGTRNSSFDYCRMYLGSSSLLISASTKKVRKGKGFA